MEADLIRIQDIKKALHTNLAQMGAFPQCALLDYPFHGNIGDHLMFLGTVLYLDNVFKTKINYMADLQNFSKEIMRQKIGNSPIIFQGGGNLGDLWYGHQQFKEFIIEEYPSQPIFILPQTIYFKDPKKLERAIQIFNSHGNLTIFVRDKYSYELGLKYFDNCKVILCPDMAFQLADMPKFAFEVKSNNSILYLNRTDLELDKELYSNLIIDFNLVVEDWISKEMNWRFGSSKYSNERQQLIKLYREILQRKFLDPQGFFPRQKWIEQQIQINNLDYFSQSSLKMIRLSLSLIHSGICQLKAHQLVITNRLHGHILSLLLGIPNIFLPNSYHKNRGFYEAWSHDISSCKFIEDISEIPDALETLLL